MLVRTHPCDWGLVKQVVNPSSTMISNDIMHEIGIEEASMLYREATWGSRSDGISLEMGP